MVRIGSILQQTENLLTEKPLSLKPAYIATEISNGRSITELNGPNLNRSDKRSKHFLRTLQEKSKQKSIAEKIETIVNGYVEKLKDMTHSQRHVFMVMFEKALFFGKVEMSRKAIAKQIANYTHKKAYDVRTISLATTELVQANIFKVRREIVSNGHEVREYNSYRLSNFLRKQSVLKVFNIAVSMLFNINFCQNITQINIYRKIYNNTNLQFERSNGLSTNISSSKQEEEHGAPSDVRGKNSRCMLNDMPLHKPDGKKRWISTKSPLVKVTPRLFAQEKSFDPAECLTTRNYHILFGNSVIDDVMQFSYSTRKVIPSEGMKKVRKEIRNPGPDGSVFEIIEFICCQFSMTQAALKDLLMVPEDILRIVIKPWDMVVNYHTFKDFMEKKAWRNNIHILREERLYYERLNLYGINPESFLKYGLVGEFQAKKQRK